MSIEEDFPIGCKVELIDNSSQANYMPLGTIGVVTRYAHLTYLVVKTNIMPDNCMWIPGRFRRVDNVTAKEVDLRTANMSPNATVCVKCRGPLKEPWPGLKHCPKCEP